jgi:lipoprotein-releasing system permease protein
MIRKIFMLEGTLIGIFGTLFGSLGGLLTCWLLKRYPLQIPGGGSVYYIEKLPVNTLSADVLTIIGVALAVCLLSTLYPAWQASRLDPIEAIRYE